MFHTPLKTLKQSLHTVLNQSQEYLADVSLVYPTQKIWAHRALLVTRVPNEFRIRYMPELQAESTSLTSLATIVPQELMMYLLRFCLDSLSIHDSRSSDEIRKQITDLEETLSMRLLPECETGKTDDEQWINDLTRMRADQVHSDVMINIFKAPVEIKKEPQSNQTPSQPSPAGLRIMSKSGGVPSILTSFSKTTDHQPVQTSPPVTITFPAHRFMLAAQSPYFRTMFCTEFKEAANATIHLPADLFSAAILDLILHYLYTDTLLIPPMPANTQSSNAVQQRLTIKKHSLRILQKVYRAADYLGHSDTICVAVLCELGNICHDFKCSCSDCAVLLPSMLSFSSQHAGLVVSEMRRKLITFYSDPVHSLSLWSQKPFAILIQSTLPTTPDGPKPTTQNATLIDDIVQQTFANITRHNAIHVLHSLHLCLSHIRSSDLSTTWSAPTLDILHVFLDHTVQMVSSNFDFYCVEYPILLSCVDGIGAGFSVDFLGFVLKHVLEEGIEDNNATVLYQGIVRDLVGRQEMVKNVAVDSVLLDARQSCASYIRRRSAAIKAIDGFNSLDKDVLRQLSDDIGIPVRTLTKPVESDFSAIFGFHPKAKAAFRSRTAESDEKLKTVCATASGGGNGGSGGTIDSRSSGRRLSFSGLMTHRYSVPTKTPAPAEDASASAIRPVPRARSHSSDAVPIQLGITSASAVSTSSASSVVSVGTDEKPAPRRRFHPPVSQGSSSSLTDVLLPIDSVASVVAVKGETPRPRKLKFELPATPLRTKLTPRKQISAQKRAQSPRRSRWGLGGSTTSDNSDEDESATIVIGTKIELLRRPLPTLGTIKYIGNVEFGKGTWVGVELESRVGNSDGAVDGKRYFQTDAQRGVFIKPDDFKVVHLPTSKA
ncbi:hypothetical protein PHYBLDRAFT_185572 [Phycomyces blakesleeanus NRRL 1555(-)]|uniref:BTB domain-containing protein n=1 Tax=Phycomyces blakesleeanus (strain ATCC 8743b / DSM 1359 / FGSC 10004 / NBRC 33097 / NRRL 1555) TaxID=763407 RepID=A0A167PBU0_PHYB8|nr:hypothetical protein PHYBLDRAFT_185572 [Phycomyces blakesleeanus NRRL 1555(-)]OAD77616.1 hypothetical protein PHYBLDRAFT_185572 [Phycomyces blakesleeanus NRRL 1555(-)]|eukprot:XP_018295656.1 hypothetical protein PHYBLDRAFT_185572 [Phycomyces blakesleeanus NRRL 1555(-)]